jgi:hypothetical protein
VPAEILPLPAIADRVVALARRPRRGPRPRAPRIDRCAGAIRGSSVGSIARPARPRSARGFCCARSRSERAGRAHPINDDRDL